MRRLDNLTDTEKLQYRSRSERAINGIDILLANPQLVSGKGTITEKYRTIAQYIGLIQDGVSHYNYFIPVNYDIVIMLRFSNHNNENEALYNLHEQKGRPDNRYIIFFQGDGYAILFNGVFCEAQHFVYNYPTYGLDKEEDILAFLTALRELFEKGRTVFRGVREEPRLSNDDITAQWSKTIDKNNGTNESKNMKKNVIKLNEDTLRQIVAESVKKVLNEEMSGGVIDEELEEIERILNSIVDTLNLNEYAPNGINGLDKERAISGIKSIKNGISTLYQATSNISSEY